MILEPIPTPDISEDDVYIVDSNIPVENLLGGKPDDIRYFVFANDSIFLSNNDIKLQAGVDFQGKVGDTLVLIYDGNEWLELSRSLNPLYAGGALDDYTLDSGYILNEINNLKNQVAIIQQQLDKIGAIDVNTTIHFTPSMSRNDMQVLIDNVRPTLINGVNVKFIFENGAYILDQPLVFRNFGGSGHIDISAINYEDTADENLAVALDSHSFGKPVFQIFDCSVEIQIAGLDCYYSVNQVPNVNEYGGIVIINSERVNIHQCYAHASNEYGSDIYYSNSSGIIRHTFTNKGACGITATNMSDISIFDCYSNDSMKPQYGISSQNGSEINLWDNKSPSGVIDDTLVGNGGRIYS